MSTAPGPPALLVFSASRWRSGLAARELRAAGLTVASTRGRDGHVLSVEVPLSSLEALELVQHVTGRDPRIRLLHRSNLPAHVDQPARSRGRDDRHL